MQSAILSRVSQAFLFRELLGIMRRRRALMSGSGAGDAVDGGRWRPAYPSLSMCLFPYAVCSILDHASKPKAQQHWSRAWFSRPSLSLNLDDRHICLWTRWGRVRVAGLDC